MTDLWAIKVYGILERFSERNETAIIMKVVEKNGKAVDF